MTGPHMPAGYRPEIDGLRAIAVLSVVLFHFGVPGLGGGFVGVDVFFVISGFLIGGHLWDELVKTGRIALGQFYLRRIRRLAPAFFAVVLISFAVGWVIMLPFEFRAFGKEVIAASVWLSNVLFYREAGYFDVGAENRVLLHTWSLSVEEQFYIFLPLCLLLLTFGLRARNRLILGFLTLIWLASLLACIWLTPTRPISTFYLFPYRAWEMLSGVLIAISLRYCQVPARWASPVSWLGLGLTCFSIIVVREAGFPGWQAVLPVAGAVLLLWGTSTPGGSLVKQGLSHPGMVLVGMISYSLYLWHWPVLVLSKYWRGEYSGWVEALLWMCTTFALAYLSWRFVEQPVRRSKRVVPSILLSGAVSVGLATVALGWTIYRSDGLASRFPAELRTHITASGEFYNDWRRCSDVSEGALAGMNVCAIGPEGPPKVLLWGDSHMRAWMAGLEQAAHAAGTPAMLIWQGGCPPVFGIEKRETAGTPTKDRKCWSWNDQLRAALPALTSVERVLLIGRWAYYADGQGVGQDAHNKITLTAVAPLETAKIGQELFAQAFQATVRELRENGLEVFALRQVPEMQDYNSREVSRDMAHGRMTASEATDLLTLSLPRARQRSERADTVLRALASSEQIRLIDPWPGLCAETCNGLYEGVSYYFDNNHITNSGARALSPILAPVFLGEISEDRS